MKKVIFPAFVPHTTCNIKSNDCNIGHIDTASHVRFDEDKNNHSFEATPSNFQSLQHVERNELFPLEIDEVSTEKVFQFYVYPFAKIVEKTLKVKPKFTSPTFGLS